MVPFTYTLTKKYEEQTPHVFSRRGALEEEKIRQSGFPSGHLPFLHKTPGKQGYTSNWQLPYTDKFIHTESNHAIQRRQDKI